MKKHSRERFFNRMFKGGCVFCAWCSEPLTREVATLEHNIPRAEGGRNVFSNYLIACYPCNQTRGKEYWSLKRSLRQRPNCQQCGSLHSGSCPQSFRRGQHA